MPVIVADIISSAETAILSSKPVRYIAQQPIAMALVMTLLALAVFYFIESKYKAAFWVGLIFLGVLVIQRVVLKRDRYVGSGESYKLGAITTGPRIMANINPLPADEEFEQRTARAFSSTFPRNENTNENDDDEAGEDDDTIGGGSSIARILNAPSVF